MLKICLSVKDFLQYASLQSHMLDNRAPILCPVSTAGWCLWECVLHSSGETQNSVCVRLENGERSHSDTSRQLRGPTLQPNGDEDLPRKLRWITLTRGTSQPVCFSQHPSVSVGLFFSNGHIWRRQRRFAMAALRTFGLAKSSMEQSILEESHHLQEAMEKEKGWQRPQNRNKIKHNTHGALWLRCFSTGEPFDPVPLLNNAVANIICQIVFGRRFDYSDHVFHILLHNLTEMVYLEGSVWALVQCLDTTTISVRSRCTPWKHVFSPNSCMMHSQHWWNTCRVLTTASSAAPNLWRLLLGER